MREMPPIEDLRAGDAFRELMLGRADGTNGPYPWWHGWVIMYAFLAGIKHAEEKHKEKRNDTSKP